MRKAYTKQRKHYILRAVKPQLRIDKDGRVWACANIEYVERKDEDYQRAWRAVNRDKVHAYTVASNEKRKQPFDPWRRYGPKPWDPDTYLPVHTFVYYQYLWERARNTGKVPKGVIKDEELIRFKYENGWRNNRSDGYRQYCKADKAAVSRGQSWNNAYYNDLTYNDYLRNTGQWEDKIEVRTKNGELWYFLNGECIDTYRRTYSNTAMRAILNGREPKPDEYKIPC